jgi:hypothetical protein
MDVKSEDNSSWDLIPLSTPQRKKLNLASVSTPKKRSNPTDQCLGPTTPQKKLKVSSSEETPLQLPSPAPTAKKSGLFSTKASSREDVSDMQDSDDQEQNLPSLFPFKRSSSDQPGLSTPVKRVHEAPQLPTPREKI